MLVTARRFRELGAAGDRTELERWSRWDARAWRAGAGAGGAECERADRARDALKVRETLRALILVNANPARHGGDDAGHAGQEPRAPTRLLTHGTANNLAEF